MRTRYRLAATTVLLTALFTTALAVSAQYQAFGTSEFEEVWERTDYPVEQQVEARTWIWGPKASSPLLQEEYAEAGGGTRTVQYTDKSRMEMPWNGVDPNSAWSITQGLLAKELMTGELQLGDASFQHHSPANIPAAGDHDNNPGPTYDDMGDLMNENARPAGNTITEVVNPDGSTSSDNTLASYGVTDEYYISQTDHNIASVFWEFMNSTGTVYENGGFTQGDIFENPFYAVGYPLTEAYWGEFRVGGTLQNVLIQCFERRCLTYNPDNPEGWQVEAGNIGQHYYEWRYNTIGSGSGSSDADDIQLSFDPGTTNSVDDDVMLIALVKDQDGDPVEGVDVEFSSDVQGVISTEKTNQSGAAVVLIHEHTTAEFETITASVQGGGPQDSETLEWIAGEPDGVIIEVFGGQQVQFRPLGDIHQILATVVDQYGNPIGGETVEFSLTSVFGPQMDFDTWTFYPSPTGAGIEPGTSEPATTERETNPEGVVGFQFRTGDSGRIRVEAEHTTASRDYSWVSYCHDILDSGQSMQSAIDNASAGDVLCARDGTYTEALTIDVEGLKLLGGSIGTTAINSSPPGDQPGVVIAADDVSIRDFTITRSGDEHVPVIAIAPGINGASLVRLDVSSPDVQPDHPDDPAIGNLDDSQAIGNVVLGRTTVDRPIGFRLADGSTGILGTNSVTRSYQEPYWLDWEGSSGESSFMHNDYSGTHTGNKVTFNIVPDKLNGESPGSAQEAADTLVCDNALDQAEVDGMIAASCP